jgi:hypothetical protein
LVAVASIGVACGLTVTGIGGSERDGGGAIVGGDGSARGDGGAFATDADVSPISCEQRCSDAGGSCEGGICLIDCPASAKCSKPTCPDGVPCHVICSGDHACPDGVDCKAASRCSVDCLFGGACGPILCTGGANPGVAPVLPDCTVFCRDGNSCTGAVTANAEKVAVTCNAGDSCHEGVTCGGGSCSVNCIAGGACGPGAKCCAATCTNEATSAPCP